MTGGETEASLTVQGYMVGAGSHTQSDSTACTINSIVSSLCEGYRKEQSFVCGGTFGVGDGLEMLQSRVRRGQGRVRYLPLIQHVVDHVRGARWPTVPHQDVFKVAGVEFHVSKETKCVLCRAGESRVSQRVGTLRIPPSRRGAPHSSALLPALTLLSEPWFTPQDIHH